MPKITRKRHRHFQAFGLFEREGDPTGKFYVQNVAFVDTEGFPSRERVQAVLLANAGSRFANVRGSSVQITGLCETTAAESKQWFSETGELAALAPEQRPMKMPSDARSAKEANDILIGRGLRGKQ